MKNVQKIINQLAQADIEVFVKNGQLKARAAKGQLSPVFIDIIKNNKTSLLKHLIDLDSTIQSQKRPKIKLLAHREKYMISSYAQQRLWFIDHMDAGSAHYNMSSAMQVFGEFDLNVANLAFTQIIKRHETLRTHFVHHNDLLHQVIQPYFEFAITIHDIQGMSEATQHDRCRQLISTDAKNSFDLSKDLMLRVCFIKTADKEGYLLFNMHHIASDGWSITILVKEFVELYKALIENRPPKLPTLDIQYADYSHWQRQWLQGEILESQLNYWEKKLADLPQVHDLPLDYERPSYQTFNGAFHSFIISGEVLSQLEKIATEHKATLFMVVHAAFAILMSRYSNNSDIVIGTPVANRLQKELELLIGFFANTLVLRADCCGDFSFLEFLQQIKNTNMDAQANQDVPFEHLVDRLNPERSTRHNALFQVLLSMNNNETSSLDLPDVTLSPVDREKTIAKFDLELNVMVDETCNLQSDLYCSFIYNTDLFDQNTIERFSESLQRLFKGIVENPTQKIAHLPLLHELDIQYLLSINNNKYDFGSHNLSIQQLFEQQVAQNPSNKAIVYEQEYLTYDELNQQSNQLANYLINEHNVRVGDIIGVSMNRSIEMIVGLLAILKAGGAYLPLDPEYPVERINYIVKHSELTIVLTQITVQALSSQRYRVAIDDLELLIKLKNYDVTNPVIQELSPEKLAYVIYTSGSTGQPKGVMIQHKAFVNFIVAMQKRLKNVLNAHTKWLAVTTISFDIAGLEIFGPLSYGGQVILASKNDVIDPGQMIGLLEKHNVTCMQATPATWQMMLDYDWQGQSNLTILSGGEALPLKLANALIKACHELWNCYGPTEATIWSLVQPINRISLNDQMIRIGNSLPNYDHLILDRHGELCPKGVIGELHIGGSGLAKGYLNDPELTAQRFVNNPFTEDANDFLYRTGDLVRYLNDGSLLYIGRTDHQIKVRGFRIELGEIEHQLQQHHGTISAVVTVNKGPDDQNVLVAYFTSNKKDDSALIDDIRCTLQNLLPEYMVPSIYVRLKNMPLTPNGKVNRKALPDPEVPEYEYVAPQGEAEERLSQIWSQLLHVEEEKIGREANFFELGGHSLLSVRLLSEIRNKFNCELSVRDIFEGSQLYQLAEKITLSDKTMSRPTITKINRDTGEFKPSYAQQRLWFIDQMENGSAHYNIPSAMRVKGQFNIDVSQQCFQKIIERHEILRTVFVKGEDGPLQVINDKTDFNIVLIDLSAVDKISQEDKIKLAIGKDVQTSFNLHKDLMLRVSYLRLCEDEGVLLFNMHHIASDGWSIEVLVKEFTQLYCAYLYGNDNPLQPLSIQYVDYAHWQREWLESDLFESQLQYWQEKLTDLPQVHGLPLSNKRPSVQTFNGASTRLDLGKEELIALKEIAQDHKITLFMLLHGAFSILLSRYSDSNDIVVGTPVANRLQKELEPLIGMFVNTLILRIDCSQNPTFADFLQHVKNVNLDAQANQDVPFEHLVDFLNPVRSTSYSALIQILFSMNTNETQSLSLPKVTMSPENHSNNNTKFELILNAAEHEEGLIFHFKYNKNIFNASFINGLGKSFLLLLKNIIIHTNGHIAEFEILDDQQRDYLLYTLNDTHVKYSNVLCIHQVFEKTAINKPNEMALVFEDQSLTYLELNQKANQLSHYLQAKGITENSIVGLYSKRSVNMIVAMIAILKCGAAYLPLDTNQPKQRLNFIMTDSGIDYIVSDLSVSEFTLNAIDIVNMNDTHHIRQCSCDNPEVNNSISQLAYIIYTSGSTGLPKGVMVEHKNVMAYYLSLQQQWQLLDDDKVSPWLWNASYAFDASVKGLLSLCAGRGLVMPNDTQANDPRSIVTLIQVHHVGIYNASPHLMDAVLSHLTEQKTSHLPHLIIGGEHIPSDIFTTIVNYCQLNNRKAINAYGPTETTINSTFGLINNTLNIGHPIANTQVYILDHDRNLVPYGSVGELYIGGDGISRGYLNRQDLTTDRFINHEFPGGFRTKLYRSGDLVRYQADGELTYMGRIDDQVKLRGFRIEIGEIEHHLATIDGITSTRVMICKDQAGQKQLVAYLILDKSENDFGKDDISAIKRQLKLALPDYMIPNFYMRLDDFPITFNGKIDYKALPKPERTLGNYVAPVTEIEQNLVAICSDLLSIDKKLISIDASFFEMGGHSLLSVRLLSEIRNTFDCELSIKTVFKTPHLSELANQIELSEATQRPKIIKIIRDTNKLATSYAQQRLWFIDQMEGGSAHYNMPSAMRVKGDFNIEIAQRSFQQIIARHETLRTVFVNDKDGPLQVITDDVEFKITHIDLTEESNDDQDTFIKKAVRKDAQSPFDLRQDLMLRVSYLSLSDEDGVLLFNMHHIASDGWSMGLLVNEFTQLYRANIDGVDHGLQPLSIQYADYAHWQRHWLAGEVFESQLSYWDKQLADLPQVHELPLDHDRPSLQTFNGASHSFSVGGEVLAQVEGIAKEHQVTLFMFVHAVLAILLSRYSNNTDIVIGTPVANRLQKELEGMIGYFVNTLVLRCECRGDLTFIELLQQIKNTNVDAQTNQDIPFEYLVDRLNPERSVSHNPLFQVLLNMNTNETSAVDLPNVSFSPEQAEGVVAKFDLVLNVTPINDGDQLTGMYCSFIYNTDLFEQVTIKRISDSLVRLFSTLSKDTTQLIAQLPLLDEKEKRYLLEVLNDTKSDYPDDLCIHQLFEQQVEKTPDNMAVFYEGQSLTYRELNERANQLAHYLINQDVESDSIVGICVERSIEMMVAVLAVLKAGAAYLPLDPDYPQNRLDYIMNDSQLSLLITQQHLIEMTSTHEKQQLIMDDDEFINEVSACSTFNPFVENLTSRHLAYVIYTSGSTGVPKGVMIEHLGAINLSMVQKHCFEVNPQSNVLQFASMNFDAATWEWMMALMNGACLYICEQSNRYSPEKLSDYLISHQITHLTLPPAVLQHLDSDKSYTFESLIVAGEACDEGLSHQWGAQYDFYNAYGPTETTVCATISSLIKNQRINIGQAINNTELYVLGDHQQLLPFGSIGELYIGGAGLARGYMNQEQLTAQRFMQVNIDGEKKRLYRTGDLVQYLDDGNLVFLGRVDDQVKIRGFRVELGEIEQQLKKHSQVVSSLVLVSDEQKMIAYVIVDTEEDEPDFIKDMRLFLKNHLPDYMIPSAFVILEEFPLTVNGKIDRKALPDPEFLESEYMGPQGEIEIGLCQIWSQLLHIEQDKISRSASFFELGGHSLLSVRLLSEIRNAFDCELSIKTVFEKPLLSDLADAIQSSEATDRPRITQLVRDTNQLIPSYAQQRLWFIDQMEGGSAHYNMPSALRVTGDFNFDVAEQAFQQIIDRHETLRTVFVDAEDGPFQVIVDDVDFTIRYMDLTDKNKDSQNDFIKKAVSKDAQSPFNLRQDLMLRASYLRLCEDEGVLLFNMHHIASDGWSMGLLVKEFTALYRANIEGAAHPLQPLSIQYADYAHWQRHWLASEVFETQLRYWDRQLADLPQVHDLPMDHDRPSHQTFNGASHAFSIDGEVCVQIEAIAKEQKVTVFMLIHAAFAILLSRYSNNTDIVIGTPVANRLQKELEGLIGYFVNTLVLRCECRSDFTFIAFLQQIKRINVEALANQDVPFEYLVDRLNPERSVSHNPLFQVLLNMNTNETSAVDLPKVSFHPEQREGVVAKFDLTLNAALIKKKDQHHGLSCSFVYNTDLFDQTFIERLTQSLLRLFSSIAKDASQSIAQLPILGNKESLYLLETLNNTQSVYPHEFCIHQLFEQQVARTPNNCAVIYKDQSITYKELNKKANQLAHYLIEQGIATDDIVGLCMHRSIELSIAIIAVFKAGGAYLPLDPDYPISRLQHMITNSGSSIVITQKHLFELTKNKAQQLLIDDDSLIQELDVYSSENPVIKGLTSGHLAYVIYTSGSTGLPKGVMIEHQALVNRIHWMQNEYQLTKCDVVLQKTPYSFDVSVWELTWFFTVGAQMVMAEPDGHKDPDYMIDLIKRHHVTTMHFVPSMFRLMLANRNWSTCDSLRQVFCSGEALPADLAIKHYGLNKAQLHNLYGPTEAAIDVSYWPVPDRHDVAKVPIGKPIDNIQLLILNDCLQLQPQGSPGELYIGGTGLARGYLNQAELTEERFINNPFTNIKSNRLYRTGDVVRYLENGDIEFLGRVDHQVKLRGLRIELDEIDYQLSVLPEINASVTIVKQQQVGHEHLVTYFTSTGALDERTLTKQIQSKIKQQLPNYMVPSIYIRMNDLPLTPNGKIDHKALPDAELSESEYSPPQGTVEILLSEIWSQSLNIDQAKISREANFFELGGHSLLLLPLVKQLKERGINCSIKSFYEHQTLAEICQTFKSTYTSHEESLVKLNDCIDGTPLFIVHPLIGRVDCYVNLAQHLPVPVFGIQAPFFSEHHIPFEDIYTLAAFYVDAITKQQKQGPYRIAGWSAGGLIAQQIVQVLNDRGLEVEYFVGFDSFMIQPYKQKKCRYEALKQVMGTIEKASELSKDILSPDLIEYSYDEQLNRLYDAIDFSSSGMSKLQIIQGFKFRVNFFMATIELQKQNITGRSHLFIAEKNQKQSLLLEGWEKAINCQNDSYEYIDGDHESLLIGNNLQRIIKIMIKDFEQLKG